MIELVQVIVYQRTGNRLWYYMKSQVFYFPENKYQWDVDSHKKEWVWISICSTVKFYLEKRVQMAAHCAVDRLNPSTFTFSYQH